MSGRQNSVLYTVSRWFIAHDQEPHHLIIPPDNISFPPILGNPPVLGPKKTNMLASFSFLIGPRQTFVPLLLLFPYHSVFKAIVLEHGNDR